MNRVNTDAFGDVADAGRFLGTILNQFAGGT
jgi:hypothetical protein